MDIQRILDQLDLEEDPKLDSVKTEFIGEGKILLLNPHAYDSYPKYLKFLRKVSDGTLSNMAKLIGDIHPVSCGYNHNDKMWIMPDKGPGLVEGEQVPHHNYIIEKIHYDNNNGYYVLELKESENN